jgi:hypothetical protein
MLELGNYSDYLSGWFSGAGIDVNGNIFNSGDARINK